MKTLFIHKIRKSCVPATTQIPTQSWVTSLHNSKVVNAYTSRCLIRLLYQLQMDSIYTSFLFADRNSFIAWHSFLVVLQSLLNSLKIQRKNGVSWCVTVNGVGHVVCTTEKIYEFTWYFIHCGMLLLRKFFPLIHILFIDTSSFCL